MTTATAPTTNSTTSLDDRTTHVFCCNRNLSLCGRDVSEEPEVPDGTGHDCIVCLDLEEQPCPHCGDQPEDET